MPPSVTRWIFYDPALNETWVVPRNPDAMTSPYPERKFVYNSTTAGPAGTTVVYEAHADPAQWQFSGKLKTQDHFSNLMKWSRKKNRLQVVDHLGRVFFVTINKMDMVPVRVNPTFGEFWTHSYTATCSVYASLDADIPGPSIGSVLPNHGPGGTVVTIQGINFTGATSVKFGTESVAFTLNSDTSITTTVPEDADGSVPVTVTTLKGTSNEYDFLVGFIL